MMPLTLDEVLTSAETLSSDEQEILENLLRKRRIEAWRHSTTADARTAIKAFRAGRLQAEPVEAVIGRLRTGLETEAE